MALGLPKAVLDCIRRKAKLKANLSAGLLTLEMGDFDPALTKGELESLRVTLQKQGFAQGYPSWVGPEAIGFKLSRRARLLIEKGRL
jgi:hypothetical protein